MELTAPEEFKIDQVTLELISDAKELADVVNQSRPLSNEVLEGITKELLGGRVYNSNSIEGNTLNLRETRRILETGMTVPVDKRREATEVVNLGKAISEVEKIIPQPERWSDLNTFLYVHRTLLTGIEDHIAGTLRNQSVMISGAKYQPPDSSEVKDLIVQLFKTLEKNSGCDPIIMAVWVHWGIARIHPFFDGNGRMARLWQDVVLFGNRFTTAIIPVEARSEYYLALTSADAGDLNPLAQLVTRSLLNSLQFYVNAQRESDEIQGWAKSLVGESNARLAEQLKLEYIRWTHLILLLRDSFERCAIQITNVSTGDIEIQLKSFDIIGQPTWETLRAGGHASKTWLFWINFRKHKMRLQYCFFFGSHHYSRVDQTIEDLGPSTCLLICEQQDNAEAEAMRIEDSTDSPITLREVLVVNDRLARKRFDPLQGECVYDENVDPLIVAQDFIQEVLLKRMV